MSIANIGEMITLAETYMFALAVKVNSFFKRETTGTDANALNGKKVTKNERFSGKGSE